MRALALLNASARQAHEVADVLKKMKFDPYVLHTEHCSYVCVGAFDRPLIAELKGVLFVTAVVTLFFFILPGPIVGGAETAAAALFAR